MSGAPPRITLPYENEDHYDCIQTSPSSSSSSRGIKNLQREQKKKLKQFTKSIKQFTSKKFKQRIQQQFQKHYPYALSPGDVELAMNRSNSAEIEEGEEKEQLRPTSPIDKKMCDGDDDDFEDDHVNNNDDDDFEDDRPSILDVKDGKPSNEQLLGTAFISFCSFAAIQFVAAIIAGSKAMLGDCAAMVVDCMTYLLNYLAEKKKNQYDEEIRKLRLKERREREEEASSAQSSASNYQEIKQQLQKAERIQKQQQEEQKQRMKLQARDRRKMVLQLELVAPLISATTLLTVTIVVMYQSISVILLDMHREESEQDNPNIDIMLGFAVANLILDLVNVGLFAKARHLLGYETTDETTKEEKASASSGKYRKLQDASASSTINDDDDDYDDSDSTDFAKSGAQSANKQQQQRSEIVEETVSKNKTKATYVEGQDIHDSFSIQCAYPQGTQKKRQQKNKTKTTTVVAGGGGGRKGRSTRGRNKSSVDNHENNNKEFDSFHWDVEDDDDDDDTSDNKDHNANLNMCSAYTHVMADTMRSFAVVITAGLAEILDNVTAEEADATAAVIVSLLILCSLMPLFCGMKNSFLELNAIRKEEQLEQDHLMKLSELSSSSLSGSDKILQAYHDENYDHQFMGLVQSHGNGNNGTSSSTSNSQHHEIGVVDNGTANVPAALTT